MAIFDDTRETWNARAPSYRLPSVNAKSRVGRTWHWAGPPTGLFGKAHQACLNMVKAWQAFHQSKGWGDVGYNALICVHARAIEGRGLDYVGTHSPGHNTSHYGIQFMLGAGETATDAMFSRAVTLASELQQRSGRALADEGHSDNTATTCPGPQILSWVRAGGPTNAEEEDMTTDDSVRRIVREELRDALRVVFTDFQKEAIGTGMDSWPMAKAVGYVSGQVATIRKSVGAVGENVAEVDATVKENAEVAARVEERLNATDPNG